MLARCRITGAAASRAHPISSPLNLRDRRSGLLVAQIEALRTAVRATRRRSPSDIDAWVVLPDHMHCLWTLPESDSEFPDRWRRSKASVLEIIVRYRAGIAFQAARRRVGHFGSATTGSTQSAAIATTRLVWTTSTSTR
jgi:REP element-mobilizing transposase RayT